MEAQTFQAREIKEALALVRRELGPDAVILETRRVPGRALGLLGGSFIEVRAAPPASDAPTPRAHVAPSLQQPAARPPRVFRPRDSATAPAPAPAAASRGSLREVISARPELAVATARGEAAATSPHAAVRRRLLGAMVPRELCEAWIERTAAAAPGASGQAFLAALRSYLRDWLGEPTPLTFPGTRVAAVVGPTGVGKTTTLAKLAARASLVGGRRVALVTTDDQRIGSTTALRAYAEALGMPMTTTSAAGGLARALATYSEADLVLVDTAGVPVGDRAALDALGTRLERAGEPITRHLCLAGSTRQQELDRILQAYAVAAPDAVLVTKLDEAIAIGSVFSALADHRLSFSFLANGQQVPDDIAPATADRLIDHVLGGVPT